MKASTTMRCCGVDSVGRSVCAQLIRYHLNIDDARLITTTIPRVVDVATGYRCTHGITYWVPR